MISEEEKEFLVDRFRRNKIILDMMDEEIKNNENGIYEFEFQTPGITDEIFKEFLMAWIGPEENLRSIVRGLPLVAEPL